MADQPMVFGGAQVAQQSMPSLRDWSKVLQLSETKDYLDNLEHLFKREIRTKEGMWVRPPGIPPLMNDLGIYNVMTLIKAVIHRVIGQGNFDKEMELYNKVLAQIWTASNDDLFVNYEIYDVAEKDISYIKNLVIISTRVYLTRLLSDKERNYIYGEEKSTSWAKYFGPGNKKGERDNTGIYG